MSGTSSFKKRGNEMNMKIGAGDSDGRHSITANVYKQLHSGSGGELDDKG